MSNKPLSIACFTDQQDTQLATVLRENLTALGHEVRILRDIEELRYTEDVEYLTFDGLILSCDTASSGESHLLLLGQIRSQTDLADMPTIGIGSEIQDGLKARMYTEGIDIFIDANASAQEIDIILRSLLRKQKERRELLALSKVNEDREIALIQTYNSLQFPVVVLHPDGVVRWINASANRAFGIQQMNDEEASTFFHRLSETLYERCLQVNDAKLSSRPVLIESRTGNQEWWNIVIQSFYGPNQVNSEEPLLRGFITILDPKAKEHLNEQHAQHLSQLEAMALHTAACAHMALQNTPSSIVVAPYEKIDQQLAEGEKRANLNSVITSLLEYLDPVISPEISITVKSSGDQTINVTFGDAFQLLGHMLFNAISFLFARGEVRIEYSQHEPGQGTTIEFTAQSSSRARLLPVLDHNTLQQELILANPEITQPEHEAGVSQVLPTRFAHIREITARYRTELLYKTKGDDTLRLRVSLPSNPS